jgi:multidrug resistance efflux pump
MSDFGRLGRELENDSAGFTRVTALAAVLVGQAWGAWFIAAPLQLYVTSDSARLEAMGPHGVDASVEGVVTVVRTFAGQRVHAGEILAEIAADRETLRRAQFNAEHGARAAELSHLHAEIASAELALLRMTSSSRAALIEARARAQEATAAARLSEEELRRVRDLRSAGLASAAEESRVKADVEQRGSAVAALHAAISRTIADSHARESSYQATIDDLRSRRESIRRESEELAFQLRSSDQEIARHLIRAPIDGVVVAAVSVRPGSYVTAGERLTTVVPRFGLHAVGFFNPATASGRVRVGQRARLRVTTANEPAGEWVSGRVEAVASDAVDGRLRIDMSFDPRTQRRLQHGLTCLAQIEAERLPVWQVVARSVGMRLGEPAEEIASTR